MKYSIGFKPQKITVGLFFSKRVGSEFLTVSKQNKATERNGQSI